MRAILLIAAVLMVGCSGSGQRKTVTDMNAYDLTKYFVDDCVVYKFYDGNDSQYFMRCPPRMPEVASSRCITRSNGKVSWVVCNGHEVGQ